MLKKIIFISFTIIAAYSAAFSQSGLRFESFKEKLKPYFADELIGDIEKEMPDGNYSVWGWAVGDYSGDGFYDVAFSVRVYSDRRKVMQVYQFVDIDGFLVKTGQLEVRYFELPLEVGVIIKDTTCYVTSKNEMYSWDIRGYRFDNGVMLLVDNYSTHRIGALTQDATTNYKDLFDENKYYRTSNDKVRFKTKYLVIPSYSLKRVVYKGYYNKAMSDDIDYVPAGAFDWLGDWDASYVVSSYYDEDYLYMVIDVRDDFIAVETCHSCYNDRLELWFDFNHYSADTNRFRILRRNRVKFTPVPDKRIFSMKIDLGNFLERKPYVSEFATTDEVKPYQKDAVNEIQVTDALRDSTHYRVRLKIPFLAFDFEQAPVKTSEITEFGCSVVVVDVDDYYREEKISKIATSGFDAEDPRTYGSLLLIPDNKWYGDSKNIFKDRIIKEIEKFGF